MNGAPVPAPNSLKEAAEDLSCAPPSSCASSTDEKLDADLCESVNDSLGASRAENSTEKNAVERVTDAVSVDTIVIEPQNVETVTRVHHEKWRAMEGFLVKRGHVRKNWKSRYFVVRQNLLLYYQDEKLGQVKGQISLSGCQVNEDPDIYDGRQNCFTIVPENASHPSYICSAASPREKGKWVVALRFLSTEQFAAGSSRKTRAQSNASMGEEYPSEHATSQPSSSSRSSSASSNSPSSGSGASVDAKPCCGWLWKYGGGAVSSASSSNAAWKRRWCVINSDPTVFTLDYYEDEGAELRGSVSLIDCTVEDMDIEGWHHAFAIKHPPGERGEVRYFIFSTRDRSLRSRHEVDVWKEQIQKKVQKAELHIERKQKLNTSAYFLHQASALGPLPSSRFNDSRASTPPPSSSESISNTVNTLLYHLE